MTTLEPSDIRNQAILKKVYRAFFGPPRYEVKPTEQEILAWGANYQVAFDGGELAVTAWGNQGPTVLLMHGWGGSRAQMTGLVDSLLFAGYRVVAYDQPAHGASDGRITNLLEIAPTMNLIAQQEGSIQAIIAHSFGTLITSYALAKRIFPLPSKLIYFGSFNRLMDSLPRFQAQAKLPAEIIEGLRAMIYENFEQGLLESINNEELVSHIEIPALLFHDTEDNVTPIEDSRATAKVWQGARLIETSGLGHRGALQSKEIQEQVINFLKE